MCSLVAASLPSYPVGSCHLHDHLDGSSAEVAAVAAHHHGAALPVPQVDGGQQALDVVLQVVLLPLEHRCLPPQPIGTGPLVVEGGGLDRQHRDGARLHPPSRDPTGGRRSNNQFRSLLLVVSVHKGEVEQITPKNGACQTV